MNVYACRECRTMHAATSKPAQCTACGGGGGKGHGTSRRGTRFERIDIEDLWFDP